MIRTLIVDDEPLARARVADLLAGRDEIRVVGECSDGVSAVAGILEHRPELVFLDVQMPELDGFDVLAALSDEYLPAVIFVTAYDEFALRAFDVHAIDYLLKPLDTERFDLAVNRAVNAIGERRSAVGPLLESLARERPERLVARMGSRWLRLSTEEIDWAKAAGNYLRLGTDRGECLLRVTMKDFLRRITGTEFLQVHRSVALRVDRIDSLESSGNGSYEIRMRDGFCCQSSRSYGEVLRQIKRS